MNRSLFISKLNIDLAVKSRSFMGGSFYIVFLLFHIG